MFYGAVWLIPCWPVLVLGLATWPLIAGRIPQIERPLLMSLALVALSFAAAAFGVVETFGTLSNPGELLIPFLESLVVLWLPRQMVPSLQAGAFRRSAA